MHVDFRQGIISYPYSDNQQLFLVKNNINYIDLQTQFGVVDLTFADGNQDYLFTETQPVINAWGPIVNGVETWLYWDLDVLTGIRTFGSTLVPPIISSGLTYGFQDIKFNSIYELSPTNIPDTDNVEFTIKINNLTKTISIPGNLCQNITSLVRQLKLRVSPIAIVEFIESDSIIRIRSKQIGVGSVIEIVKYTHLSSIPGFVEIKPSYPGSEQPVNPVEDQHWFNTETNTMLVYTNNQWIRKIRLFAAKIITATFYPLGPTYQNVINDSGVLSTIPNKTPFAGSQVTNVYNSIVTYEIDEVFVPSFQRPIHRPTKQFNTLTTSSFVPTSPILDIKLDYTTISGITSEDIPKYTIVAYNTFNDITIAEYSDIETKILAVSVDNYVSGQLGTFVVQGIVTNDEWQFSTVNVPLWISYGNVTETNPYTPTSGYSNKSPIATVVTPTSIYFDQSMGGRTINLPDLNLFRLASEQRYGLFRLSVPAVDIEKPIVVGDNDPRLIRYIHPKQHPADIITTDPYSFVLNVDLPSTLETIIDRSIDTITDVNPDYSTLSESHIFRYNGDKWSNSVVDFGVQYLNDMSDVIINTETLTQGQFLQYNGNYWENSDVIMGATDLDGLSDVVLTDVEGGQVLQFNGVKWVNEYVDFGASHLDEMLDVHLDTIQTDQTLIYNGTQWVNQSFIKGATILDELLDVDIQEPIHSDHTLRYNTNLREWINKPIEFGVNYLHLLKDVYINPSVLFPTDPKYVQILLHNGTKWTNTNIRLGYSNLSELQDTAVTTVTDKQTIFYDTATSKWIPGPAVFGLQALHELKDVSVVHSTATDYNVLIYSTADSKWINVPAIYGPFILNDLEDVIITSPILSNQQLVFNSTINKWVNAFPECCVEKLDDLTDVVITNPEQKHKLVWTGTYWTNQLVDMNDIIDRLKQLNAVEIIGPGEVDEGTSRDYDLKIYYTDGSTEIVNPSDWSATIGTIDTTGLLTAPLISNTDFETTILKASYTYKGKTIEDTKPVKIVNLRDITSVVIDGPDTVHENTNTDYNIRINYSDSTFVILNANTWGVNTGTINSNGLFSSPFVTDQPNVIATINATVVFEGQTYYPTKDVTVTNQLDIRNIIIDGNPTIDEQTSGDYVIKIEFTDGSTLTTNANSWTITRGTINSLGRVTTPAVSEDTPATINAVYRYENTDYTPSKTITIINDIEVLSMRILGNDEIPELSFANYSLEVTLTDNSKIYTNASSWNVATKGVISAAGRLDTPNVSADTIVTITATYVYEGVTSQITKDVKIVSTKVSEIIITGPNEVTERSLQDYNLTVKFTDGTSIVANANSWSIPTGYIGTINITGGFTAPAVTVNTLTRIEADYIFEGVTTRTSRDITINNLIDVEDITIVGPSPIFESQTPTYTISVLLSDGTTVTATADLWSTTKGSILSNGKLTPPSITTNTTLTLTASYTLYGITKTNTKDIDVLAIKPVSGTIVGPLSVNEKTSLSKYSLYVTFNDDLTTPKLVIADSWATTLGTISFTTGSSESTLNSPSVTTNTSATITATHTFDSLTSTYTTDITIVDTGPERGLYIWGDNGLYPITPPTLTTNFSTPTQIPGTDWVGIEGTSDNILAATKVDSSKWIWGTGSQLITNNANTKSPIQVQGTEWCFYFATTKNAFFIKPDNTLWAVGDNIYGTVGDGTNITRTSPVQIPGTDWACIYGSSTQIFAIKHDTTLWAWGQNNDGTLGANVTYTACRFASTPIQIPGNNWKEIVTDNTYTGNTIGRKTDNTLWSWGYNGYGQLGLGDIANRCVPVQIPGNSWTSVSMGNQFAIALRSDNTVWTWGRNLYCQLGDGTNISRSTPIQLPGNDWIDISAGGRHVLARKSDNTLWGWGSGLYGQLGLNNSLNKNTPTQLPGTGWVDIQANTYTSFGVKCE